MVDLLKFKFKFSSGKFSTTIIVLLNLQGANEAVDSGLSPIHFTCVVQISILFFILPPVAPPISLCRTMAALWSTPTTKPPTPTGQR
eukprot:SAG22_NODE_1689_length_3806_cov_7.093067_1_plen_86_part_10